MATSLLDELLGGGGASFGNPNIQRQGAKARALAAQRDVNTLPDPRTYAAVSGLLGTAPDEMGFSVLNPQYQAIQQVAQPAFALGTVLGMAPTGGKAAVATGKALGPTAAGMTERYLQGQGLMPNIIPVETAKTLDPKLNLPSSPEFLQAVQNTPNAQITDEGLLMRLARSQKPEQAGELSGRTGVFYLPEGSSSMTHYKHKPTAPNQTYGGSELFSGETLYKNPLFIKGATGGKAPQNAYDQLLGKGAYEKMRSDVLQAGSVRSIPSSRLSESEKIDRIKETLSQYGGDPSMAENIYKSSPSGNQFAYAMQEHIVANAVRNAGYDSVLGYSKKKTGDPFLSEVFDVREKTYPSKVTESQVMNQFLPEAQQSGLFNTLAP